VFRSIGKQILIGAITGLLERLITVKSSVIRYIDGSKTDLQSPGNDPDWWDALEAEDDQQIDLTTYFAMKPSNFEFLFSGFNNSFSSLKYSIAALFGPFLFLANLREMRVYYRSIIKSFNNE
jgi:hypothetical protein